MNKSQLIDRLADFAYEKGKTFGSLQAENAKLKSHNSRLEQEMAALTANMIAEAEFDARYAVLPGDLDEVSLARERADGPSPSSSVEKEGNTHAE